LLRSRGIHWRLPRGYSETRVAVPGSNPAFDVTPAKYITAIITERGVLRAPYGESLKAMERQHS
jgi:methylthioribose-1-phosphate isomerase